MTKTSYFPEEPAAVRLAALGMAHEALLARPNAPVAEHNGVVRRFVHPVITADHVPLSWRYDLNIDTNPLVMERLAVNATFNAGAIQWRGRHTLVVRVEGSDRKSFFALADSDSGVDGFRFRGGALDIPAWRPDETNLYDMRLTAHADGYIYGLFCVERRDHSKPHDPTAALAGCGIARTYDLQRWERLPDLISGSRQQRNVVLHPEFFEGQYAFYTRPQDGFVEVGSGGGIGWGLCADITDPRLDREIIIDGKQYHTIKELKNGQGPAPIRSPIGWLHLAHGVRNTAAGLRYVLYLIATALDEPWRVTHAPGGYLLAPQGDERVGDVSNVLFSNGWIVDDQGQVLIYYASSDTRLHVAATTIARLMDYCLHTPADARSTAGAAAQRNALIAANARLQTAAQ